jgi:hypothetical protein
MKLRFEPTSADAAQSSLTAQPQADVMQSDL